MALELMISRLDNAGIDYNIFFDGIAKQNLPLSSRQHFFDRKATVQERFDAIAEAGGAYRRLLITAPGVSPVELRVAIGAVAVANEIVRLSARDLRKVTTTHIQSAVQRLLNGDDAPNFAPSRDYDAFTETGTPLAPKKVFGLALEEALGIEAYPGHFSAGWGQICFELLEEAGLWITPKKEGVARPKPDPKKVESELVGFAPTEEERSWIEGNPKIVSHLQRERAAGLAKEKRDAFIAEHKRLFCEDCKLDPVERYGTAGAACIEVHHHGTHIANMQPGHKTSMEDLKCLCANCHRVLHRKLALGIHLG
ncbi:hypothetical protein [Rhizobium sp. CIAT894]|uniref:HNH endonuclease n=1 Tax=Rhizobium sp. CIAT894 TaxID=2020312 RepID=UPI000F736D2A|nr:hypothetical protein [Rhizobium sp. CIAT894]